MNAQPEHLRPPDSHRLFIAITTPHVVKTQIENFQNEIRQSLPTGSVRWTRPEHFHLTLRFLGNVAVNRMSELGETLRIACCTFVPLNVRAEGIGFFPLRGFPRVIWTSVSNEHKQLGDLQSAIHSATLKFASEVAETHFTSHITLGRAKNIRRQEADRLANFAAKMRGRVLGEWVVSSVELFRSELSPNGPNHSVIETIPLGNAK
jgi:RNA 2',3'-cyclic 3'-phosphodiesterase